MEVTSDALTDRYGAGVVTATSFWLSRVLLGGEDPSGWWDFIPAYIFYTSLFVLFLVLACQRPFHGLEGAVIARELVRSAPDNRTSVVLPLFGA